MPKLYLSSGISMVVGATMLFSINSASSLPHPEDIPEEVLRTEIIIEARSPVDGKPLSAADYAQLQAQLRARPYPPELSPRVQENIFLLRVRQLLRPIIPFIP